MGTIAIEGVRRSFGSVEAVRHLSLDIRDSEFFTLLGPSGCGKTTLLRMIAGFTEPDAGEIRIGGKRIDTLPPHRRNIGMVFQNYAIFPNLTVAGNIAYGLKARKFAPDEIARRVTEALVLVRLSGYGERWPHQLSGGQLQRVAIARALVIRPEVLLLDEPLSNLDARLRVDMRGEIRELQQRLGITTVYVTHDQEEALAVSQRIAVMHSGRIEQLGAPEEIYRKPASLFVARFMGTTNVLRGVAGARDDCGTRVRVGPSELLVPVLDAREGEALSLCIRPEALRVIVGGEPLAADSARLEATVRKTEFVGALVRLDAELADGTPLKVAVLDDPVAGAAPGSRIALAYDPARVTVFREGAP
ncbi:MAG: ABC transporter ATP-binding protein [Betaproteobacteria bacterium]|nr:ABC transporter ATP-binding protein [Betaproteobacteria bacterium]